MPTGTMIPTIEHPPIISNSTRGDELEVILRSAPDLIGEKVKQAIINPLESALTGVSNTASDIFADKQFFSRNHGQFLPHVLRYYEDMYRGTVNGSNGLKYVDFRSKNNPVIQADYAARMSELESMKARAMREMGFWRSITNKWLRISSAPGSSSLIAGGGASAGVALTAALALNPIGLAFAAGAGVGIGAGMLIRRAEIQLNSRKAQETAKMETSFPAITDQANRVQELLMDVQTVNTNSTIKIEVLKARLENEAILAEAIVGANHVVSKLGTVFADQVDMAKNILLSRVADANYDKIADIKEKFVNNQDKNGLPLTTVNGCLLYRELAEIVGRFCPNSSEQILNSTSQSELVSNLRTAIGSIDTANLPENVFTGPLHGKSWEDLKNELLDLEKSADKVASSPEDFASRYGENVKDLNDLVSSSTSFFEGLDNYSNNLSAFDQHELAIEQMRRMEVGINICKNKEFFSWGYKSALSQEQLDELFTIAEKLEEIRNQAYLKLIPVTIEILQPHEQQFVNIETQVNSILTTPTSTINPQNHKEIYPKLLNSQKLVDFAFDQFPHIKAGAYGLITNHGYRLPGSTVSIGDQIEDTYNNPALSSDQKQLQLETMFQFYVADTGLPVEDSGIKAMVVDTILYFRLKELKPKLEAMKTRVDTNAELNQHKLENDINQYDVDISNYSGDNFLTHFSQIKSLYHGAKLKLENVNNLESINPNSFDQTTITRLQNLVQKLEAFYNYIVELETSVNGHYPDVSTGIPVVNLREVLESMFNGLTDPVWKLGLERMLGTQQIEGNAGQVWDKSHILSPALKGTLEITVKPTTSTITSNSSAQLRQDFISCVKKAFNDVQIQNDSLMSLTENSIDTTKLESEIQVEYIDPANGYDDSNVMFGHIMRTFGFTHAQTEIYQKNQAVFNYFQKNLTGNFIFMKDFRSHLADLVTVLETEFRDYGADVADTPALAQSIVDGHNPLDQYVDQEFAGRLKNKIGEFMADEYNLTI
jgi:hypothetical protein